MSEEPCQCPDCQRFYKEHDRLIRDFPTLKQQQESSWAVIQSFRTLCGKVTENLQGQLASFSENSNEHNSKQNCSFDKNRINEMQQAINDLENVNAHLYSIEALMERIFDVKVPSHIEDKFKEVASELAPDPLNVDKIILNRLFHQTPDLPDKNSN